MEHLEISASDDAKELEDEKFKEIARPLAETILNHYVALKLEEGVSTDEIIRLIKSNEADFNEIDLQFSLTIASNFTDPIKDAISNENYEVASILSGTQIEHIMNMFMNDVLEYKFNFSDNDILQILNAISLPAKLSWFFIIVTDCELNNFLSEKLIRIVNLRNKIAHFKSLSFNKKLFSTEDVVLLSNSPVLISELEQDLSDIWFKTFPQYEEASKLLKENFDISSNYLSRRIRNLE